MRITKASGAVVRLSQDVLKLVLKQRKNNGKTVESIDKVLRRLLGIPDRKGNAPKLIYWALPKDLFEDRAKAKGAAIIRKVEEGSTESQTPVEVFIR